MFPPKNLNILVMCSILLLIDKTSALKCWRCSSDATNSKFCGETLDLSQISEQQKEWSYVECTPISPQTEALNNEHLIPKCKILQQLVNEVPVYSRSCYWEQENVPANSCSIQKFDPPFVKTVACNTCNEDGCNEKLISVSEDKNNKNTSAKEKKILLCVLFCRTRF